jgi:hypothetical protein
VVGLSPQARGDPFDFAAKGLSRLAQDLNDAPENQKPRVVNLSVHLPDLLYRASVGGTSPRASLERAIGTSLETLYVVAAGNGATKLRAAADLPFPVSLHDQPNVLVVAALDADATELLPESNRNADGEHVVRSGPGRAWSTPARTTSSVA